MNMEESYKRNCMDPNGNGVVDPCEALGIEQGLGKVFLIHSCMYKWTELIIMLDHRHTHPYIYGR